MNAAEQISTEQDAVTLTPNEAIELGVGAYESRIKRALLFRGSPGIGKTTIARGITEQLRVLYPGFQCVVISPTMPADEVGGIPKLSDKDGDLVTKYALPDWFPDAETDPHWRGIILLDDGLQGAGDMQKVLANLILERSLRGRHLPDGAMIMVTGNRLQDKAGVARTLTHFADRMCWINIESSPRKWIEDFAIPKGICQEVVGYIMMDGQKLNMFDPNKEKCPTPRTWEAVSKWMGYLSSLPQTTQAQKDLRVKLALALLGGELGIGEATRFWAFCEMFNKLPNIDDILKNPATYTTDFEISVQYALVVAIAQKIDGNNFPAALEYIDRIGPDLTTLAVKLAAKRDKSIVDSKAYVQWVVKNQDVLHGV